MPTTQLTEADLTDGAIGILTLMVKAGLAASNGEARRLVAQGGVLVDGEKVAAPTVSFTAEQLAQGHRHQKGEKGLPQSDAVISPARPVDLIVKSPERFSRVRRSRSGLSFCL